MSTPKKPRSDSALKTLPLARRQEIAAYAAEHSLQETVAWLKADGLATNKSSLSEFLAWQSLQDQLQKNATTVETLLAELQSNNPEWAPEKVQAVGQSFFTALALQQQDPQQWLWIQQTNLKREQLALDRSKFQRETCELFMKWAADKRASEIANSPATNADKIERLGQLMFGEDWRS